MEQLNNSRNTFPKVIKCHTELSAKHPHDCMNWNTLNDTQKAQLFLNSLRLSDQELFLNEFKSWEEPENTNA